MKYSLVLKRIAAVIFATAITYIWLYVTQRVAEKLMPTPPQTINNEFIIYVFAGIITLTIGVLWGVLYSIGMGKIHGHHIDKQEK